MRVEGARACGVAALCALLHSRSPTPATHPLPSHTIEQVAGKKGSC